MAGVQEESPIPISDVKPRMEAKIGTHESRKFVYDYTVNISDTVNRMQRDGLLTVRKLTFLVHGFNSGSDTSWMQDAQAEMLRQDPSQAVVLVGWQEGAALDWVSLIVKGIPWQNPLTYFQPKLPLQRVVDTVSTIFQADTLSPYRRAAATTQTVGAWLGEISAVIKRRHPQIQIRGVGHSLGAHVLGKAGRESRVFSRITGLDPAGPDFEDNHVDRMLKRSDANMVDVIHTCGYFEGHSIPLNHFGTLKPLGTVDFYPNYGCGQDGCEHTLGGSHSRVLDYYIYSIRHPGEFTTNLVLDGVPSCNAPVKKTKRGRSAAEMGYHCKESSSGLYFISIAAKDVPFKYVKTK
ncbi:phospholipase A1 VesT1.02-like [Ptychodera flava]|uniref:phospholipase A1 VesT1.02-like n=1 Tax=Ptychodera flava TaxID=63121 RepID=UPI00396AA757